MTPHQSDQPSIDEQTEAMVDRAGGQAAIQSAVSESNKTVQQRIQNPDFFSTVTDADLDSAKHDWLEAELGPELSHAHFIANHGERQENRIEWGSANKAERFITEHNPGRLLAGFTIEINGQTHYPALEVAQRVHGRRDKDVAKPFVSEDARIARAGFEAVGSYKKLGVNNTGFRGVTEATAVHKQEKTESKEQSLKEKAGGVFR